MSLLRIAALEGELQRRDARILELEKMLACPSCGGAGWHSTGIDESPTTPCGKCDGSGLATHAPAPVGAGGSVGADVVHLVRWSYEDAARMVEQEDPRTSDWMWDDRNDLANAIHRRCEETIQGLATTTPEQGDATPAQSVPLGGGEVVDSILAAAYDFRDAHLSGSANLKATAYAELRASIQSSISLIQPQDAKDADRFVWWFSEDETKHEFLPTYLEGVTGKWTLDNWRAAIDAAILASKGGDQGDGK